MSASSSIDNGSTNTVADLYKAATNGNYEPFKNNEQGLDNLLIKNNNTILHVHLNSPCKRSKDFVEQVLGKCPDLLWKTNDDGDIPLHIAANYGHLEIVKLLILEAKKPIHKDKENGEKGATWRMLQSKNKQNETALHLATRGEYLGVAKEILEHEDSKYTYTPNTREESPLYLAANKKLKDIVVDILNKFESLDCSGPKGKTVFHEVIFQNILDARLFDLLWSKLSGSLNQKDADGWTPLHYAACLGNSLAVGKILEKDKISANTISKEKKQTALHMASCRGEVEIMKKIIEKCPECCDIMDDEDRTVLHYAVFSGNQEAVKTILKDSSLVYQLFEEDVNGYSPLDLLVAFDEHSSLLSWIRRDKLAVPSYIFSIKGMSTGDGVERKKILDAMIELGKDPFGRNIVERQHWEDKERRIEQTVISGLADAKNSHLVAAALVATVTFAAAFTLPGGYISDDNGSKLKGTPILSRNAAFKAFVVTDALAMMLSTSSVFIHLTMALLGYKPIYFWLIRSAFWFIVTAMGAMVVAFVTGTYAVLAPNSMELAIATCAIGLSFFVHVFYVSIRLISNFIKRDRAENRGSSITNSFGRLLDSTHQYLVFGSKFRDWFFWNCE